MEFSINAPRFSVIRLRSEGSYTTRIRTMHPGHALVGIACVKALAFKISRFAINDIQQLIFHSIFLITIWYNYIYNIAGVCFRENVMQVVSNNVGENADRYPAYGELDLLTGKWLNLSVLRGSERYSADEHIIWFPHAIIVPSNRAHGTFTTRYNIDLFRNTF